MTDLQAEIERYLLEHPTWVPAEEIVSAFGLGDDRLLRATGDEPGPLSRIAIFSGKGFKHLRHATIRERLACKHRLKRELISRVRRLRWLDEGTSHCVTSLPAPLPHKIESHSGQIVFF